MSEKKAKQKRQQLKKSIGLFRTMKEIDDCAKNMTIDEKIKSIMRHSFNTRDDGELMTYDDWMNSPDDVEKVFGEMVASLKCQLFLKMCVLQEVKND